MTACIILRRREPAVTLRVRTVFELVEVWSEWDGHLSVELGQVEMEKTQISWHSPRFLNGSFARLRTMACVG
jgi:hypothetical protein